MMAPEPPRDIRLTFDGQVDVYERVRPQYPALLFDELFSWLPDAPAMIEVGPGTGQATGDLLARRALVTAVELGPRLASRLRQKFVDVPLLDVVVGDFEHVPLPAASFDCVFSASAYHWIAPAAQVDRPAELLRPGGVLAILELVQVDSDTDQGFFDAAQAIYEKYGEGRGDEDVPPPRPEATARMLTPLQDDERFTDVTSLLYDWDQTYTSAQYRQLMQSYSATQMMEPGARDGLLREMKAFIDEHFGGTVTRPLVVAFVLARLTVGEDRR